MEPRTKQDKQLYSATIDIEELSSTYIKQILLTHQCDAFFQLCAATAYSPLFYRILDQNMAEIENNRAAYNLEDETDFHHTLYTHATLRQRLLETHLYRCLSEADTALFQVIHRAGAFNLLTPERRQTLLSDTWGLVELDMNESFLDYVSHFATCKALYKHAHKVLVGSSRKICLSKLSHIEWLQF